MKIKMWQDKDMETLTFDIRIFNSIDIELSSWIPGCKKETYYVHGTFNNTSEIVESIRMRLEDLQRKQEAE